MIISTILEIFMTIVLILLMIFLTLLLIGFIGDIYKTVKNLK